MILTNNAINLQSASNSYCRLVHTHSTFQNALKKRLQQDKLQFITEMNGKEFETERILIANEFSASTRFAIFLTIWCGCCLQNGANLADNKIHVNVIPENTYLYWPNNVNPNELLDSREVLEAAVYKLVCNGRRNFFLKAASAKRHCPFSVTSISIFMETD